MRLRRSDSELDADRGGHLTAPASDLIRDYIVIALQFDVCLI